VSDPRDSRPRAILFDVMDTLVRDPFRDVIPGFFGMTLEELLAVKHPSAWVEFERGERDHGSFLRDFFADRRSFDHAAFERAVRDAYEWLPGMEGLLARLSDEDVSLVALSNYPDWYRWIDERLGVGRYLDCGWERVSHHTGVRKPDPEAYLGAARALDLPARACLFIDDRQSNVDAARAVGMDAVRFDGVEGLRASLAERGFDVR
jgi:HAD superfamily hydrolase (TIGR01509 family)